MGLYELRPEQLDVITETTFEAEGIRERDDLQRYIAANIEAIDPDLLVLCDEFDQWEQSKRRIDLLCVDRAARLVVVELKRTQGGGHMELQALRYAAMISQMTLDEAAIAMARYHGLDPAEAREQLNDHFDADPEDFGTDVAVVLVSANFSPELMASVLWLNQHQLDIKCVRLRPYKLDKRVLVQSEQIVPPPEAEHYQFRMRHKDAERREIVRGKGRTGTYVVNVGEDKADCRNWDDHRGFGFLSAGGGPKFQKAIGRPKPGALVFAYLNTAGYVGCGRVLQPATPYDTFRVGPDRALLSEMPTKGQFGPNSATNPATQEHCLAIEWLATRDRDHAIRDDHRRGTCTEIHDPDLVRRLIKAFGVTLPHDEHD